ncbi:hypothetical protein [Homoserinibacter sp. YIM 151385]|uniref:hypothetical protein n=1 Tax=Homoserinibacter sp. YIM 151385 TaxID=2985506 RepID=UPI0022F099E0|nr:hypothetical protein [Homoserinibacter sp. YIM 151385]WBU37616.1 hypothetical protein OF852_11950 [Homoserinibacter sp. YIM 151385]
MIRLLSEPVIVHTHRGRPTAIDWSGRLWRVTDDPTPIRERFDLGVTHPLEPLVGWRFQGTATDGEARVFDARLRPEGGWELVGVYA